MKEKASEEINAIDTHTLLGVCVSRGVCAIDTVVENERLDVR